MRDNYLRTLRAREVLEEHLSSAENSDLLEVMRDEGVDVERMGGRVRDLKKGKSTGSDVIRGELLQALAKRDRLRGILCEGLDDILENGETPDCFLKSLTAMIQKIRYPSVRDFRPIAVTSVGSKLLWGEIRDKIEEHIEEYGLGRENQLGFTKGGDLNITTLC